jgi:hypothetical protein
MPNMTLRSDVCSLIQTLSRSEQGVYTKIQSAKAEKGGNKSPKCRADFAQELTLRTE